MCKVCNKEKERKAREKETKERESRYSNGHLFTSLSVSATTLCSACNKSITAKEALSCPTCNVTIHNRCRDTLANCAKMKQKQQRLALVRNAATLHNVALRSKNPILKERPSSAIYPSETLRQSFLGSRKGRSTLSLNKSVSTNNIAGLSHLHGKLPILVTQYVKRSSEQISFGSELIQTEFNHVRTLRIMEGVFRRGMLEEVLMEMGVVHAIFPCLDQLLSIHSNFLSQLLQRRNNSSEEESKSLADSLTLIRELLCSVDQQVQELERAQRLQEIQSRLDPRAETKVKGGGVFGGGELLRRRLIHEGALLWKTAQGSRLKDVHVLLMTDILVFMQEKDQKYIFPCLNLIVRDIANQERGMFLISHSTPPEMYELHAASKEGRNTWMKLVQQTVSNCPSREDFPLIETEDKALLRRLRADIQQKDREVLELLQERVTLFSDLVEATGGQNVNVPTNSRNIFRADTPYAPQAEKLLSDAIVEVDRLSEVLLGSCTERPQSCRLNGESTDVQFTSKTTDKGTISVNGTHDINSPSNKDRNGNQLQDKMLNEEVLQRLVNLSTQLHALQAAVIKQDSFLELYMQKDLCPTTTAHAVPRDALPESGGPAGTQEDLAELQRKYNLLQGEVIRLRATQDKTGDRAPNKLEKQLQELRLKDTKDTRDTLISQETVAQVDGMQETVTADSPRGNMRPASFS
ncbi:Rho guanine nucleotide exchange factor 2 [Labeo rohita]|uniref:Rho guanine nucleotide exchange factor 2 n=1 Tax=Labeo rohita TaxID=84645 RepID=A0ABQ8LZI0_LABRO|nr:Rho guanine nucleotide exchange factor 2 [Labeo rohita]